MDNTKILDWLGRVFKPKVGTYTIDSFRAEADERIALETYALFTVVNLIANLLSGCELRTYRNGIEQRGAEWAAWNIRPNRNQNAPEFWHELISRLLLTGEALCIMLPDGQRIIAESFVKDEYAVYDTVFSQVSRCGYTFAGTFRASDVIYLRSTVNGKAAWIGNVMRIYEKLLQSATERFQNADGERGTLNISAVARGKPKFEEDFKRLVNEYFKGYFSSKSAVLPLFDGYEYHAQNTGRSGTYTNDLTAVKTLVDEAISREAQIFGVPPSLTRGDAAGIADAQRVMLTDCIDPFARMISSELTGKLFTSDEIARGCCMEKDTGSIMHDDLIDSAGNIDKLIGAGWSHNEVRRALGQHSIPEKWADEHYITKNYQTMELAMKGGEEHEA